MSIFKDLIQFVFTFGAMIQLNKRKDEWTNISKGKHDLVTS